MLPARQGLMTCAVCPDRPGIVRGEPGLKCPNVRPIYRPTFVRQVHEQLHESLRAHLDGLQPERLPLSPMNRELVVGELAGIEPGEGHLDSG